MILLFFMKQILELKGKVENDIKTIKKMVRPQSAMKEDLAIA